ncbi:hypothetical protein RIF29_19938 [Crotalaria pallida]|uniref:Uncharacterized protein n=1 Tax=Crotalaria pallida TaxID=3830 RepID=A0AAN9F3J1_CROPI
MTRVTRNPTMLSKPVSKINQKCLAKIGSPYFLSSNSNLNSLFEFLILSLFSLSLSLRIKDEHDDVFNFQVGDDDVKEVDRFDVAAVVDESDGDKEAKKSRILILG